MIREKVKESLTARLEEQYRKELGDRKGTYPDWIRRREKIRMSEDHEEKEKQPEARLLTAPASPIQWMELEQAWVFYAREGRLSDLVPGWIGPFLDTFPEVLLFYGDEDVEDGAAGERRSPWWKPGWSPDTFCGYFYWGSVVIMRRDWRESREEQKARELRAGRPWSAGGETEGRKKVEERLWTRQDIRQELAMENGDEIRPSKFYPFVMEMVKRAGGFQRESRQILRIPQILFHAREEALQKAYEEISMKAYGLPEEVGDMRSQEEPLVSFIIPSRDHPDLLRQCLTAICRTVTRTACEVILVDNGSSPQNRRQTEEFLSTFPMRSTYLYRPMDFHFSRMCNLGAQQAAGKYLLFLNDDVEVCEEGWLEKMLAHAARPYTGAVGLKLYYPGGCRIQHAGITNLSLGPVHKLQFLDDEESFDHGRNRFDWNVMAVTGACLMCRRELFRSLGGFSEDLAVAFNDVELCLHLWTEGYVNVVVNESHAFHHESVSRGTDESVEKLDRLQRELARLYSAYPGMRGYDPYYPGELNRDCLDTRIRPAYLTAGNPRQLLLPRLCGLGKGRLKRLPGATVQRWKDEWKEKLRGVDWEGLSAEEQLYVTAAPPVRSGRLHPLYGKKLRRDDCLLFRVERCDHERIQGYGVVLGDNNACYDRYLLICPFSGSETAGCPEGFDGKLPVYIQPLWGQYRPDLEENLPDQDNVGLCGFCLEHPRFGRSFPWGDYRLGMIARNRITGLLLLNWSNRIWHRLGRVTARPVGERENFDPQEPADGE